MSHSGYFQRLNQTDDISSHVPTVYTNDFTNQPWQGNEKIPDQPLITPVETATPPPIYEKPKRQRTGESNLSKYASSLWSKVPYRAVSHLAAPLFAAPWRHEPCEDLGGSRGSTVRRFDRGKQRRRSFCFLLLQFCLTLIFCAVIVGVFYHYDSEETVSQTGKYLFNASFLGLSLLLSFAIAGGLKEYATIFRWRLLSQNWRSLQEFELILSVPSQRKALRLIWVAERWQTKLICFLYVFIHVGLQVAIALLGLCQSVDTSPVFVETIWGNTSIANLQVIAQAYDITDGGDDSINAETGSANIFGIGSQTFTDIYDPTDDDVSGRSTNTIFANGPTDGTTTSWSYDFIDLCPQTGCTTSINTYRSITSEAVCTQYNVTSGGYIDDRNVTWIYPNGTQGIWYYGDDEASGVTSWWSDVNSTCGPRCMHVFGLNIGIPGDDGWTPQVFDCYNTVNKVQNITDDITKYGGNISLYEIPDEQARYFAGAIGFNGLTANDTSWQHHVYDTSSFWSWTVDREGDYEWNVTDAANRIMMFSVGAIGNLDQNGQRIYTDGWTPVPAQSVSVTWMWAIVILSLIPGIQFACLLLTITLGNSAVVKDESYLAAARLLRPIVERLENNGCVLTGDEICEVLGNPRVAYGLRMPHNATDQTAYSNDGLSGDQLMHIDVLRERSHQHNLPESMAWRVGQPMPQGHYDGFASSSTVDEQKVGLLSGLPVDPTVRKRRTSF